jgi:hypothetical protein
LVLIGRAKSVIQEEIQPVSGHAKTLLGLGAGVQGAGRRRVAGFFDRRQRLH